MMCESRDELNAIELVVVVVVVYLEVMKLHLFRRHLLRWLIYLTFEVLHYVPNIHKIGPYSSSSELRLRATGRHLPYGIMECYLPPDTSERAPP